MAGAGSQHLGNIIEKRVPLTSQWDTNPILVQAFLFGSAGGGATEVGHETSVRPCLIEPPLLLET